MNSVSIIIVNYNVTNELTNCLHSIYKFFTPANIEVIVVDNNSSDKPSNTLTDNFQNVKFIFLDENLGYANANMIGYEKSSGEYLLFLNPDTEMIEDIITPIIQFIHSNSMAGVCGPMLIYHDGRYQNSFGGTPGFLFELSEAFLTIKISRKLKELIYRKRFRLDNPIEVGWVSGACMIIKKNIFEKVNGFNTDYFLNYEDIDICTKTDRLGFKNYYLPKLKCIHLNQKSMEQDYEKLTYSRYFSRLVFAKSHYNFSVRLLVRFIHILGLLLRLIFVNILYHDKERNMRRKGYLSSLYLYISFKKPLS